jgi:hypothetical protein
VPHIRYRIESDCDSEEPSRLVLAVHGEILEFQDDTPLKSKIGEIFALLVQRGRAMDENKSLYEAMDSIDAELFECYEALFEGPTDEWSERVEQAYGNGLPGLDVLFIEGIELDAAHRGKGIAAQVVRETISTFGSSCGIVACRPGNLEYEDEDPERGQAAHGRECLAFEADRPVGVVRFAKFWEGLGFRKLPGSDFYTFAPQLVRQPDALSSTPVGLRSERAGTWVH